MQQEIIHPASEKEWLELRVKDLTSTDIGSLFGINPYCTLYELWHRKRNQQVVTMELQEWTKWGKRLQDSIAAGIAEDEKWTVRKMDEYIRLPELRLGASFDFSIESDNSFSELLIQPLVNKTAEIMQEEGMIDADTESKLKQHRGLLEIKNVFGLIFKDQWLENEDGTWEAPPHIELQVQHQLLVSQRQFAYIGVLVSGNQVILIKRLPDEKIIHAIKNAALKFWLSVDSGIEPPIDFIKDADFLSKLYNFAEPGKVIDGRGNEQIIALAEKHRAINENIKVAEEQKDAIKAQLLMMIGNAEKVVGDGFSITAGMVGPTHVSYDRAGYRLFKINWPRKKKE